MIVVDTNVIAPFYIQGDLTQSARDTFAADEDWVAPTLWRSEMQNVLAKYLRAGHMSLDDAIDAMTRANFFMRDRTRPVDSERVLRLVSASRCTAYDCEFVALAQELGIQLITTDSDILRDFPSTAIALNAFARS